MTVMVPLIEKLGLTRDTHVVVYDSLGVFSSPRGVYTFKGGYITFAGRFRLTSLHVAFGHDKVSALDGGLPRWIAEGGEVEMGGVGNIGESEYEGAQGPEIDFVRCKCLCVDFIADSCLAYEQIVANSKKPSDNPDSEVVLDHRPLARLVSH